MLTIEYTRPHMVAYQKEIMDCEQRFAAIEASTKSGKTTCMIAWLLEQALVCQKNQSVYWVAPIFLQAKIAFDRMKAQISVPHFFKVNESRLTLTLPQGAIIEFKSADTPDSLYGNDCYAAVIDEASRMKEESWFAIRSTLTKTRGKCKLIGNVKGKSNFFYRMAQKAKAGETDFFYKRITAYDAVEAKILDIDEIEAAKRELPEAVFKELYLAEASEDGSNPFGYKFIQLCTIGLSTHAPICFGIDLAKSSDYTVIIGLDQFGQVCHFDRFQKDWMQTVQTILALPNLPMKIDSTGVGDPIVEQVQNSRGNVEGFKFTAQSKQQLMEGLAVGIQHRKVLFPDGIIKDELENFEFEYTKHGVRYSAPEGLHDDCVCALALAWAKYQTAAGFGQYSWS